MEIIRESELPFFPMILESMVTGILDFSLLPAFFSMFCLVYIFAYYAVFRDWSPKHRSEASSCLISLAHGTPATILAACLILAQTKHGFASPNTRFQNLVLDFSTTYFVVDLLHYIAFFPGEYLFIVHHLATLFVFITCRYLTLHGAFAVLGLLVLAEVTSACQNVWTLAGLRKVESPLAARIHSLLSPPFYTFYSLVRGFAGPLFFYQMSIFYLTGKGSYSISWWVSLSWILVVGGAIAVSILWVLNNWMEFFRERTGNEKKKKSL